MSERRGLAALLVVFALLLFAELPGSWLLDPDESRYAEIPREMLATGDWITPRLNAAHYFEKPPLLYWANAASIAVLGHTPFAARLPTRLATIGTAVALIVALGDTGLPTLGWWAALLFLAAPLSWALGRMNLTDGVLTFGLTVELLALRAFLRRREEGARALGASVLVGLGAALAVMAKGLIGIVLPGLVLLAWAAVTSRWRRVREILLSPAPLVFLALTAPWFVAVSLRNPAFAQIFFVREHFARFATPEARRPGPIYYFVVAFVVGFLPFLAPMVRAVGALRGGWRDRYASHRDELFFALWAVVVIAFFSLSRSKLLPYVLPAFPAAAALGAYGVVAATRGAPRWQLAYAVLLSVIAAAGVAYGLTSGELARYQVAAFAVLGAAALVASAWVAVLLAARDARLALGAVALGWGGVYVALIAAMPRVAGDLSSHDLAVAAGRVPGATVVAYRTYPQSFPWELRHPIVVADYIDELGSDGIRPPSLYWSASELRARWAAGESLVVVTRPRSVPHLVGDEADPPGARPAGAPVTIAANREYVVVTNVSSNPPLAADTSSLASPRP